METKLPSFDTIPDEGTAVDLTFNLARLHAKKANNSNPNKLFLRKHLRLLDQIISSYPLPQNFLLLGTPGIAKSMALLPLLIKRVQAGHPVAFHQISSGKTVFVSPEHNTSIQYINLSAEHPFVDDPKFTLFLDESDHALTRAPDCLEGTTIYASSPKRSNYKEYTKISRTIYFPVASLKELISFNEKVGINLPEEEVKKRYNHFGGVFRALTYDPAQYSENLDIVEGSAQDLQQIDRAERFLLTPGRPTLDDGQFSHRLIHYDVGDDLKLKGYSFASDHLFQVYQKERLDQFLEPSASAYFRIPPKNFTGQDFEKLFQKGLQLTTRFLYFKPLSKKTEQQIEVKTKSFRYTPIILRKTEKEISEMLKSAPPTDTILIPESQSHELFDGYLGLQTKWHPFQVSFGSSKTLNAKSILGFLETHKDNEFINKENGQIEIYCVVPPGRTSPFGIENIKTLPKQEAEKVTTNFVQLLVPFPKPGELTLRGDSFSEQDKKQFEQDLKTMIQLDKWALSNQ